MFEEGWREEERLSLMQRAGKRTIRKGTYFGPLIIPLSDFLMKSRI
jgi:hypothetical protein